MKRLSKMTDTELDSWRKEMLAVKMSRSEKAKIKLLKLNLIRFDVLFQRAYHAYKNYEVSMDEKYLGSKEVG